MHVKDSAIMRASIMLRPFFRRRNLPPAPRKIIVIKPCCLGDVVNATPTIAALKHHFPQAQIDVAVGVWSRAALKNNPHIRRVIDSGNVGQGNYGWRDVRALARQLRGVGYDLAVTLDRSPVVGLIPWLAGIPHRVGLDSLNRGFAHTRRVFVPQEPQHEAALYLNCVAEMGKSIRRADGESKFWTEFYPAEEDRAGLPPLPEGPFIILHPGGGVNPGMTMIDKRWPVWRYVQLAHRLSRSEFQLVLTGTVEDVPLCKKIQEEIEGSKPLILAGKITLGQFGALCQKANVFIGGDTGATHIAAAVGCKTLAIFGPSDPKRYAPFVPNLRGRVLWRNTALPTGGVSQGTPEDFSWDNGITVDDVMQEFYQLLKGDLC